MSSFSEIRSRHGNDPLTDTISDMLLKINLNEAITEQVTIADKISPVKILRSTVDITDFDMMRGYARDRDPNHNYKIGFEPDNNNVRLDIKFDNGGEYLWDYSKMITSNGEMANLVTIGYDTDFPVLTKGPEDDGVTPGEICSIFDGVQHYVKIPVNEYNSIKQMVADGKPGFTIPFRLYPLSILNEARSGNTKRATLFYFIENDQVEYATKAEFSDDGKVHFFVRHNSETFYVASTETVVELPENVPDYFSPDYDPTDYNAAPDTFSVMFPIPLIDLTFEFDFTTKQLTIWKNGIIVGQTAENPSAYTNVGTFPINSLIPSDALPFPPYQDDPEDPPPPGTPTTQPFSKVYEQTFESSSVKVNKVTVSGQVKVYDVAGGAPVADPFAILYNVPEGTGSNQSNPYAAPFYNMAGASSTGNMVDSDNEIAYGQYIRTTSSALYGKKLTRLQLELNGLGDPTGGTVYLGIVKANGTTIKFGAGIAVADIPDAWQSYQRTGNQDIATQYTLAVGDGVGVIWEGGTGGQINIRRTGSNVHQASESSGANSCQAQYVTGEGWTNVNTQWAMAAVMETGGEVISVTPWLTLDKTTYLIVGEQFGSGGGVVNNAPSKIELKVKKKAGTTGTLHLQIVTSGGATKTGGALATWNIATDPNITTSDPAAGVFNLVWENVQNTVTVAAGERICLLTPASGTGTMNTGGEVYVMSNRGNNTPTSDSTKNYHSTSSYVVKRNNTGTWSTIDNQIDISGKVWRGGNDFTGYIALDNNRKRCGILADTATSIFVAPSPGKVVTRVVITAKKQNNPAAGAIYCRLRNASGDLKATIGQKDISNVTAADTSLEFLNTENLVDMDENDQISIEYDQGTATDCLLIRINKNAFETTNTILFESLVSNPALAIPVTDRDLAAEVYTGGTIDATARPIRGMKIKTGSPLIGKAISEARLKLKRTGTFGAAEFMSVKIIRGSDKTTIATLDTKLCNDVSSAAFVEYNFTEVGNAYSLQADDLIAIENNNGDSTKYIEIRTSSANVYDGVNTIMFDYNNITWNEDVSKDLYGTLWIGGYTIYPDPSLPIPPDPYHYYHGWFIGASTTPDSGGIITPDLLKPEAYSYTNMVAKQFRIYTMLLTETHLTNYFENRFTITSIDKGHVEIVGHEYLVSIPA